MTIVHPLWDEVALKDVGTIVTGRTPPSSNPAYFGSFCPFITPTDMTGQKNATETERFLSEEGYALLNRCVVPARSVAVSCIGWQMGKAVITTRPSATNQQLNTIVPNPRVDSDFLYYHLCTRREELKRLGSVGTRTPIINKSVFASLKLRLPSLAVQRRIAGILSAYDDLIENDLRRIGILEEMARALYREWFVEFRFAGHEETRWIDSALGAIPEDWEVRPFSELATYVNGYAFKPADWGEEGKAIIKIRELKAGVTADTPRNLGGGVPEKYHVRNGDLLFSWSADLDAYIWASGEGLLNQHLFNVVPLDGLSRVFCYHALKEAMPRFRALSLGATMHHIKRAALDQVSTLVPPRALRHEFEIVAEPVHQHVIGLAQGVSNLRRTRDLLLPRLLSGQIALKEAVA